MTGEYILLFLGAVIFAIGILFAALLHRYVLSDLRGDGAVLLDAHWGLPTAEQ